MFVLLSLFACDNTARPSMDKPPTDTSAPLTAAEFAQGYADNFCSVSQTCTPTVADVVCDSFDLTPLLSCEVDAVAARMCLESAWTCQPAGDYLMAKLPDACNQACLNWDDLYPQDPPTPATPAPDLREHDVVVGEPLMVDFEDLVRVDLAFPTDGSYRVQIESESEITCSYDTSGLQSGCSLFVDGDGDLMLSADGPAVAQITFEEVREGDFDLTRTLAAADVHTYLLSVPEYNVVVAYTEGSVDTFGEIWNVGTQTLVESNDDSGDDTNFHFFTELEAGTYELRVRGYNDQTSGSYDLVVGWGF